MEEHEQGQEINEARRRADEAREAWRRARDELREVVRRSREEWRRRAAEVGPYREEIDDSVRDMVDAARDFAREIGFETRRLANDTLRSARGEWQTRWREQWHRSFGADWQDHWIFGGRRFRQWTTGGEDTNPFVAAMLSRGGGLLAVYVLHLLAERPRHGNDIMRQIEQRTMGSWTANPGAIYPLLSFMEEKQLVQSEWEDPDKRTRRIYHITDEGRQELVRLRRILRSKVMEAIEVLHVLYDDLYGGDEQPSTPEAGAGSATSGGAGSESTPPTTEPTALESSAVESEDEGWRARLGRLLGRGPQRMAWFGS